MRLLTLLCTLVCCVAHAEPPRSPRVDPTSSPKEAIILLELSDTSDGFVAGIASAREKLSSTKDSVTLAVYGKDQGSVVYRGPWSGIGQKDLKGLSGALTVKAANPGDGAIEVGLDSLLQFLGRTPNIASGRLLVVCRRCLSRDSRSLASALTTLQETHHVLTSTVGVGAKDRTTLSTIADLGGGRLYMIESNEAFGVFLKSWASN